MEFVRVASRDQVPAGRALTVEVGGEPVAVFEDGGELRALHAVCPHADGPLGDGTVIEGAAVCPLHGWAFDLDSGRCRTVPRARVARYAVKVEGGDVLVSAGPVEGV